MLSHVHALSRARARTHTHTHICTHARTNTHTKAYSFFLHTNVLILLTDKGVHARKHAHVLVYLCLHLSLPQVK